MSDSRTGLAVVRIQLPALVRTVMNSRFRKGRGIYQLNDCQLLKKESAYTENGDDIIVTILLRA